MKNMRTLQKRIAYQLQQGSLDAEVTGITLRWNPSDDKILMARKAVPYHLNKTGYGLPG